MPPVSLNIEMLIHRNVNSRNSHGFDLIFNRPMLVRFTTPSILISLL